MSQLPVTKFVSVPIKKAIQVKQKNEMLYKLSLPFSYQIGYRYMNGFDLDFDNDKLFQVREDFDNNYNDLNLEVPSHLIYVSIIPDKNFKEEKRFDSEKRRMIKTSETRINQNLYSKIVKFDA